MSEIILNEITRNLPLEEMNTSMLTFVGFTYICIEVFPGYWNRALFEYELIVYYV